MIQSITVDLIPNGKMPMLHASQYDDGRQVRINLTENRQAYTLTGNEVLSLAVRKADNTLVTMDIANTYGGKSYVEFATTEQMCACAGLNFGELTITNNGTKVGSLNFYLCVEVSPEQGGVSQSEINNLARQVEGFVDADIGEAIEEYYPAIDQRVDDEVSEAMENYYTIPQIDSKVKVLTDNVIDVPSKNLFDKTAVINGKYINATDGSLADKTEAAISALMPIEANALYYVYRQDAPLTIYMVRFLGEDETTAYKPLQQDGTPFDNYNVGVKNICVKAPSNARYMQIQVKYNGTGWNFDTIQVEKGTEHTSYEPYTTYQIINYSGLPSDLAGAQGFDFKNKAVNDLYKKTILWNGDSICAGDAFNDTENAWAGRIAVRNNMTKYNYAVGGGCITVGLQVNGSTKHSVCGTLQTMYSEHPKADYVIFTGGTNDADIIGDAITTTPAAFGTYNMNDYGGTYDESTFCGAFESICYRITRYWRGAKIGYIIPHKMGILNTNPNNTYYPVSGYYSSTSNRRKYYETAKDLCKKWGINVLDLWNDCYLTPMVAHLCDFNQTMTLEERYAAGLLYADRQHLTAKGYDYETELVEAWLRTL